jgi:hypothetical protein
VPGSGADVGHDVADAGDVIQECDVVVVALVERLHAKQIGWRPRGRTATLLMPVNGSCVVATGV